MAVARLTRVAWSCGFLLPAFASFAHARCPALSLLLLAVEDETMMMCEPIQASCCPPNNVSELALSLAALRGELYVHALRLCRCAHQAEDLVQDTVVRALRFEASFEAGSNLRAWTHQILFNLFISRCRQKRRESKAIGWLSTDPCAWTVPSDDRVQSTRLTEATQRALESLPERFRTAVELVDLREQSYREVAEELGVPVGTIMSRLHRGRRLLADALRESPMRAAA